MNPMRSAVLPLKKMRFGWSDRDQCGRDPVREGQRELGKLAPVADRNGKILSTCCALTQMMWFSCRPPPKHAKLAVLGV